MPSNPHKYQQVTLPAQTLRSAHRLLAHPPAYLSTYQTSTRTTEGCETRRRTTDIAKRSGPSFVTMVFSLFVLKARAVKASLCSSLPRRTSVFQLPPAHLSSPFSGPCSLTLRRSWESCARSLCTPLACGKVATPLLPAMWVGPLVRHMKMSAPYTSPEEHLQPTSGGRVHTSYKLVKHTRIEMLAHQAHIACIQNKNVDTGIP